MKVVRLSALRTGLLYHQHLFLVLISVRGWVVPRVIVRPEWWSQWKIPMTSSAIKPATFRLVVQWLNQLSHRVPPVMNDTPSYTYYATEESPRIHATLLSLEHLSLCCIFSVYITNSASQLGQGTGPLNVGDNEGRCFPFSAYRLRLQPPLEYISFPELEVYHVIISATIRTYGMTRREQGVEARHVAIQSNLASPPFTHFCLYAYLQWAPTVRFQLSGLVTLMASWGKKSSFRISYSLNLSSNISLFLKLEGLFRLPQLYASAVYPEAPISFYPSIKFRFLVFWCMMPCTLVNT